MLRWIELSLFVWLIACEDYEPYEPIEEPAVIYHATGKIAPSNAREDM